MAIELTQELKKLRTQLAETEGECRAIQEEIKGVQRKYSAVERTKDHITRRIREIEEFQANDIDPSVTEHAMLRYVERVLGIPLEDLKSAILTESTKQAIKFAKTGKHKRNDCTIVYKDNTVVTVEI